MTFPYTGIFAVIEARHNLDMFVRHVVRNIAAISCLFAAMYALQDKIAFLPALCCGWAATIIALWTVQKIRV